MNIVVRLQTPTMAQLLHVTTTEHEDEAPLPPLAIDVDRVAILIEAVGEAVKRLQQLLPCFVVCYSAFFGFETIRIYVPTL